ncbi:MAG: hypothetical protein ACTSUT_18290 [Promethearchaeota archaeon]
MSNENKSKNENDGLDNEQTVNIKSDNKKVVIKIIVLFVIFPFIISATYYVLKYYNKSDVINKIDKPLGFLSDTLHDLEKKEEFIRETREECINRIRNITDQNGLKEEISKFYYKESDFYKNVDYYSRANTHLFYIRYIGCQLEEARDEEIYKMGLDYVDNFVNNINEDDFTEREIDIMRLYYEGYLEGKMGGFAESGTSSEIFNFEALLVGNSEQMGEYNLTEYICPDMLPELCMKNVRRIKYIPESFCENICEKLSEYEIDYDKMFDEVVVNNFNSWEDGEDIAKYKFLRRAIAWRYGGEELLMKICEYETTEKNKRKCLLDASSLSTIIESRKTSCADVRDRMVNLICDN